MNRENAHEIALESSVVAPVLIQVIDHEPDEPFTKTASELLLLLNNFADEKKRFAKAWPKTPAHLSNALKRLAPHLLAKGIVVTFERTEKERTIKFEHIQTDNNGKTASSSSFSSHMTMNDDGMTLLDHNQRHPKTPNDFNGLAHNFDANDAHDANDDDLQTWGVEDEDSE